MDSLLLGYTGFIGGNLMRQRRWDRAVNRTNVAGLRGPFGTVVCAAAPGTKWWANKDPEADHAAVKRLLDALGRITAERFVLISTADVFGQPVDADEDDDPTPDCTYGENRLWLEQGVRKLFPDATVVRLPGVIGPGLRKNPWFDMQAGVRLDYLNPHSVYQWYDVSDLWADIAHADVPVQHLCPPPESLFDTVSRVFPHLRGRLTGWGVAASYNLRSIYQDSFRGAGADQTPSGPGSPA